MIVGCAENLHDEILLIVLHFFTEMCLYLLIILVKSSQLIHLFSNQYHYKFNMPKIYTNYFIKVISLTKTRPELEWRAA